MKEDWSSSYAAFSDVLFSGIFCLSEVCFTYPSAVHKKVMFKIFLPTWTGLREEVTIVILCAIWNKYSGFHEQKNIFITPVS